MTKYFLDSRNGKREVEADDWKVEGELLIFFQRITGPSAPEEQRVYAEKLAYVNSIQLRAE